LAKKEFTHRERVENCLAGADLDRPPVALWRHFPVDDQTPEGLAAITLDFQRRYDFDLVKVSPASSFCTKDWGVQDEWRGAIEGTREYTRRAVQRAEDWSQLPLLDPHQGALGATLDSLRKITAGLSPDVPVIQTVFSPLMQAKYLVGPQELLVQLRRDPDAIHQGLKTVAESTRRFVEAALQTGIAGIFYAVQFATFELLSVEEYQSFGRTYDLQVLEAAQEGWLNMLHLHGDEVMFDVFVDYPVQVINWHDRDTYPSLREARAKFSGALCGGLQRERTMVLGIPDHVTAEAQDAIEQTGGRGFILGTGCVLPIIAPHANILAARRSVERGIGE
jgi:uroporphyrinogen decarboxylase